MTLEDKTHLRTLRDNMGDEESKRLLRKTINHIHSLETRLSTVRTLLRTAINEATSKQGRDDEEGL